MAREKLGVPADMCVNPPPSRVVPPLLRVNPRQIPPQEDRVHSDGQLYQFGDTSDIHPCRETTLALEASWAFRGFERHHLDTP
eukprot:1126452-Pyramimonas_sp.AAC.1